MARGLVDTLERQLEKARKAADYRKLLGSALEALVQLDSGMIEGRVVAGDERTAAYDRVRALATTAFHRFAALDAGAAGAWVKGLAIWQRPKQVDFAEWAVPATATEPVPSYRATAS